MATRVISLNAWGGRLHAPLLPYLQQADPDILCLQEVLRSPETRSDWLVYRDNGVELPQRAHLYDELCAALPGHDAMFHPTARGTLFDGDALVSSEFGLATFVRKSYPVIGQAVDFVHGEFAPAGWGPHPRARNAHCLRLFSYADDFSLTIAQMHGLRDVAGKADTPARRAQAEAFAALIRRVWQPGERLVACGDFNVLPESATFATLAKLGLTDLVTARGYTDTRTSHYRKSGRFADYMLVSADIGIVNFDVVAEPEVLDHRPLLLDLA
jgi:endonuclease/exonuclease/phosphatase family metal-dependent hydrolase